MIAGLQNAKGPASVGALPDHGSNRPGKDLEMNTEQPITGRAETPALTRRRALGLLAGATVPSTAVIAVGATEPAQPSIDDFLARASQSEIAWYHANALALIMNDMHPERSWRSHINHEHGFCLVVGDPNQGKPSSKVKVFVDDGSPLLADDVTGTTAFADWEAGR